jgi:orotidine-5'-phosphate decarboxylase
VESADSVAGSLTIDRRSDPKKMATGDALVSVAEEVEAVAAASRKTVTAVTPGRGLDPDDAGEGAGAGMVALAEGEVVTTHSRWPDRIT